MVRAPTFAGIKMTCAPNLEIHACPGKHLGGRDHSDHEWLSSQGTLSISESTRHPLSDAYDVFVSTVLLNVKVTDVTQQLAEFCAYLLSLKWSGGNV